ncbi:uncharacterized protein LOC131011571 isoform X2 [Salvia miltiorrhiza]|uniref:uncharacterized protein LOC131011571 isoform X2 n=1 Tax=Salvia miltiorrhiza TaxID=226208 RepID=UPI0025AD551B|nr:uncharacterized protein LOC131011571 isoform X2 [Salvia miltiorrhiza]
MKVTIEKGVGQQIQQPTRNPPPPSDLPEKPGFPPRKPPRRKTRPGVRLRRESGAPTAKRSSRPETPLLRWKFDEGNQKNVAVDEEVEEAGEPGRRRNRSGVSSRKLAAGLWRLRLAELQDNVAQGGVGLQSGGGHFGASIHCRDADRVHRSPAEDPDSPHSVSGPKHGLLYKFEPSFQFPNYAMEGATKWDPDGWKASDEVKQIFSQTKPNNDHRASSAKVISALEAELEQARTRINELETDRRSSKKKLEQFLRKLSEERAAWRSREHEKVRAIIDDMKADVSREKKNRQRLEIVNSKLVNELADAKLSAKRYLQEYEKERKARALIEEVCDELAKEIGEDKAEVEALKRESMKLREEVDEERKMLQMAEVWREERVQMKLVDAKVMLEEKYSQMNRLIAELEPFLNSRSDSQEIKKADFLRQAAASLNIQDVRELTYEPPNSDDIFSVFEDVNFGESNEREVEPSVGYTPASHASKMHTVSPEIKMLNKDGTHRNSNVYMNQSGELEEDASEWETVSHPEDQGSSYSPDGSDPSVNKNFRASNVSMNGMEWEKDGGGQETPIMEISEVDSARLRQLKKVSSISKLWRSCPSNGDSYKIISVDGKNGRLSNGRLSNAGIMSPDHSSAKGCLSPQDLSGQWSSPDSGNPHVNRAMKGCIEWPRTAQKNSLKARLLEARMESQKVQLRQVLKHKI